MGGAGPTEWVMPKAGTDGTSGKSDWFPLPCPLQETECDHGLSGKALESLSDACPGHGGLAACATCCHAQSTEESPRQRGRVTRGRERGVYSSKKKGCLSHTDKVKGGWGWGSTSRLWTQTDRCVLRADGRKDCTSHAQNRHAAEASAS